MYPTPKPFTAFWQAKLLNALSALLGQAERALPVHELRFVVRVDSEETQGPQTNLDFIMYRSVLPHHVDRDKTLEEVLDLLVSANNEFPLFVKISSPGQSQGIIRVVLTISKRFRHWHVIKQWHGGNELAPFQST